MAGLSAATAQPQDKRFRPEQRTNAWCCSDGGVRWLGGDEPLRQRIHRMCLRVGVGVCQVNQRLPNTHTPPPSVFHTSWVPCCAGQQLQQAGPSAHTHTQSANCLPTNHESSLPKLNIHPCHHMTVHDDTIQLLRCVVSDNSSGSTTSRQVATSDSCCGCWCHHCWCQRCENTSPTE